MAELIPEMSQLIGVICVGVLFAFLMLVFVFRIERIWGGIASFVESLDL